MGEFRLEVEGERRRVRGGGGGESGDWWGGGGGGSRARKEVGREKRGVGDRKEEGMRNTTCEGRPH